MSIYNNVPVSAETLFPPGAADPMDHAQTVFAAAVAKALQAQSLEYRQLLYVADTVAAGATQLKAVQITPLGPFKVEKLTGSYETLENDPGNVGQFIDTGVCHLSAKLSDQQRARTFMNDFIPLSLMLSPGRVRSSLANNNLTTAAPSNSLFFPMPWEYVFGSNSQIQVEVKNSSNAACSYDIAFWGYRFVSNNKMPQGI